MSRNSGDAQNQLLCEGEEGHLQVYSRQHLFSGYVGGEPGDTAAAFTADSWFRKSRMKSRNS
ncbi:hypothetical protein [Thiorhodovibrio frisius]|uniref:hypothetical protein n=1 Tax=Thiorhodovibrio frisius TaxID=631362 RepID=UPI00022C6D7B|nr:hypothetical protein [Thiorhodovibrio frisius]WPL21029.1 hypothetical protein Thiofri_01136 [Thiorhodovibrio frisius]